MLRAAPGSTGTCPCAAETATVTVCQSAANNGPRAGGWVIRHQSTDPVDAHRSACAGPVHALGELFHRGHGDDRRLESVPGTRQGVLRWESYRPCVRVRYLGRRGWFARKMRVVSTPSAYGCGAASRSPGCGHLRGASRSWWVDGLLTWAADPSAQGWVMDPVSRETSGCRMHGRRRLPCPIRGAGSRRRVRDVATHAGCARGAREQCWCVLSRNRQRSCRWSRSVALSSLTTCRSGHPQSVAVPSCIEPDRVRSGSGARGHRPFEGQPIRVWGGHGRKRIEGRSTGSNS